jgi:uncharacterized membrane protein
MRKLILCLAACGATAVCLTHPAGAQEKFNPTVCNQSGEDAQFAVIVRTSAQTWRVRGWYQADDRKCAQLPPVLGPTFYVWAATESKVAEGDPNDRDAVWECVFRQAFDYDASKAPNCSDQQKALFFRVPGGKPVVLR